MRDSASPPALIVFLRLPESGKVKTRIAAVLGEEKALDIYLELSQRTLQVASKSGVPVYLFYDPGLPPVHERLPGFTYEAQIPGHLGAKMAHALSMVLRQHAKAVIIGSDCPALSPDIIHEGFDALDQYDIVIGPSEDGGYYLLGCTSLHHMLFQDIAWGSDSVLHETQARLQQAGLTYGVLQTLSDIDTAEDWERFKAQGG